MTFEANRGERQSLLHCRIAAADHGDNPVAKQRRVAARALAHAISAQALLARDIELFQRRSRCDNDGARQNIALPGCHAPLAVLRIEAIQAGHHELGAGRGGLVLQHRTQVVTWNAFGETGIAFDLFDAHELAAGDVAGQNKRLSPEAYRRHGGGQAGDAASRYHDVALRCQCPYSESAQSAARSARDKIAMLSNPLNAKHRPKRS